MGIESNVFVFTIRFTQSIREITAIAFTPTVLDIAYAINSISFKFNRCTILFCN